MRRSSLIATAVVGAAIALLGGYRLAQQEPPGPASPPIVEPPQAPEPSRTPNLTKAGTPKAFEARALTTEQEAVDRALELFDKPVTAAVARLMSRREAVKWYAGRLAYDLMTLPERTPDPTQEARLAKPAWIVALASCDFGAEGTDAAYPGCSDRGEMAGTYFVLNASNAKVMVQSDFTPGMYDQLLRMPNEQFKIVLETPETLRGTPAPTPSWGAPVIVSPTPGPPPE
jgi:hypothetical protein